MTITVNDNYTCDYDDDNDERVLDDERAREREYRKCLLYKATKVHNEQKERKGEREQTLVRSMFMFMTLM